MHTPRKKKETKLERRREREREARQNESEVHTKIRMEFRKIYNYSFNKYCCLARSPIQCYAFPSI